MSQARDDILANIRRSLGVTGAEALRRAAVEARLAGAPAGIIPERGRLSPRARVALFVKMAREAAASVTEVASADDVPAEAARYLRENNLPARLRRGADPRLAAMPWSRTQIEMAEGRSAGSDLNAVSHAFAGAAESGTLALVSGPDNPTTLNFLPDNHIVVLEAADIEGDYEAIWAQLRAVHGKGGMPRAVNLVTGPSRSADIEQTLILGAHGPRRLHVIIVGAPAGEASAVPAVPSPDGP